MSVPNPEIKNILFMENRAQPRFGSHKVFVTGKVEKVEKSFSEAILLVAAVTSTLIQRLQMVSKMVFVTTKNTLFLFSRL